MVVTVPVEPWCQTLGWRIRWMASFEVYVEAC